MKKRIITIGCIAVAAILMALIGGAILWTPTPDTAHTSSLTYVDDCINIYENAVSSFRGSGSATMEITTVQQLNTNHEVLTEQTQQTISYRGYNTRELAVITNELLIIGDHTVSISEAFSSGTAYVTVDGSNFRAPLSAEEYQSRIIPATLLDSTLYKNIRGLDNGSEYFLYFSEATNVELWAAKDGWKFSGAKGFALVNHDGIMLKSAYAATYTRGTDTIHLTVYAEPTQTDPDILIPENSSVYTQISYLDGPRMLEKASGYLLQSNHTAAYYTDRIFCQAFGDERTKSISLFTADNNSFSARIDTETVLTNTGRVGDVTRHTHNELFVDGVYTIRADQGESTQNTSLTSEAIKNYCKDQLVSTIMMPQDIVNTEISEIEHTLKIAITPSEVFAALVSSNACQTLYQKPALLNELATNSATEIMECYLIVDKYTCLPISSGVEYGGLYTIEGIPYRLQYKADQSYNIASADAQNRINEAAGR